MNTCLCEYMHVVQLSKWPEEGIRFCAAGAIGGCWLTAEPAGFKHSMEKKQVSQGEISSWLKAGEWGLSFMKSDIITGTAVA